MNQPTGITASSWKGRMDKYRQTMAAECPVHGPFTAERYLWPGRQTTPEWTGCPVCRDEAEQMAKKATLTDYFRQLAAEALQLDACIPARFRDKHFANFRADTVEQAHVLDMARDYVEHWPEYRKEGRGLLLLGAAGTGKTHIMAAICNELMARYRDRVVYTSAAELIMAVKAAFRRDSDRTESDVYADALRPELLCIDEFGRGYGSDAERNIIFQAVNARYQAMKPTLIASNMSAKTIKDAYGDAVFSRLMECGDVVQSAGANMRYA